MYHISAPLAWIRDGAIRPIPFNMHSQFHFLVQMQNLLLLALPGSGVACCKMTQLYYAVLLSLLAWIMGRRYYGSNVGSVLLCTTLLGWDAATVIKGCLMDLGTAFFTLSGIYFLVRSMEGERWKRHLVSGIFFGLAFSSKNTGILFFLVAGIAFALMPFIDIRERKKGRFVFLLFSGLVMILVALPWIVKNIAFTGNPFYPFLCRLFPTRWDYAVMAEGFSRYYSGFSGYRSFIGIVRHLGDELGLCIINIPYRECLFMAVLTITGGLLLVLKRGRLKTVERFLVLLGFLVLPMMILTPFSRFVAAFYPLAVLLFLGGMMRVFGKGRVFLIILILFVSGMAWRFGRVHVWTVEKGWNLKLVTGDWNDKRGKWGFLYEYYCLPNRDMVDYIDKNLDDGDRVLICENHWMLSECPVPFIPNPHMHAPNLVRILLDEKGEEYTVDQLEKWGVTHLVIKGGPDSIPSRYFRERYCSDDLILYEKKDAFFSKVAKKGKKGV